MAWNNDKILNFIDAIHEHTSLWDVKHPDYRDRAVRRDEWGAICREFNITQDEALRKYKNLRTYFVSESKKADKSKCMDGDPLQESNWFAYKKLLFLKGIEDESGMEGEREPVHVQEISQDDWMRSNRQESQPPSTNSTSVTKKRKHYDDNHFQDTCNVEFRQKSRKSQAFGQHVIEKLFTYSSHVRNQVEYKISTILYQADMGFYDDKNGGTRQRASNSQRPQRNRYRADQDVVYQDGDDSSNVKASPGGSSGLDDGDDSN